jgi:Putative restriction endonuclease
MNHGGNRFYHATVTISNQLKLSIPKPVATMTTQLKISQQRPLEITWEPLPAGFQLEDEPVENTGQPLLAGALRESLEIAGNITAQMLIASNFAICATVNGKLEIKAPDWIYVPAVKELLADRKSYTPHLEGDVPLIVMEFLSETEGGEYSNRPTSPLGKWFFYEQILAVPIYVIFEPEGGLLELYRLQNGHYELDRPDENGRHWLPEINLFLGTWRGRKEARSGYWLRWWQPTGEILSWAVEKIAAENQKADSEVERAEFEYQRAEAERQRADREQQEKEKLIAYLRSQGIDPQSIL